MGNTCLADAPTRHSLVCEGNKETASPQKLELDAALRAISADPVAGEAKVGDLVGIRVYKFRLSNQMYLLAYRILDAESLKLLTLGSHENFYRDLKRIED